MDSGRHNLISCHDEDDGTGYLTEQADGSHHIGRNATFDEQADEGIYHKVKTLLNGITHFTKEITH